METLIGSDRVSIRDGKQVDRYPIAELQPMLHVGSDVFSVFLDELSGHVQPGSNGELVYQRMPAGNVQLTTIGGSVDLMYHSDEWHAFCNGAAAGEFRI